MTKLQTFFDAAGVPSTPYDATIVTFTLIGANVPQGRKWVWTPRR